MAAGARRLYRFSTAATGDSETTAKPGQAPSPARLSFSLRRKNGRIAKPTPEFWHALERALPLGTYWREEVLAGRAEYPPADCTHPPRECGAVGDRGRLYPHNYVGTHRGQSQCADCLNHWILEQDRKRYRYENGLDRKAPVSDEELAKEPPREAPSPSAQAFAELSARGLIIQECELETEDPARLQRLVARYANAVGKRNGQNLQQPRQYAKNRLP